MTEFLMNESIQFVNCIYRVLSVFFFWGGRFFRIPFVFGRNGDAHGRRRRRSRRRRRRRRQIRRRRDVTARPAPVAPVRPDGRRQGARSRRRSSLQNFS